MGPVGIQFSNAKTGRWRTHRPVVNAEECNACNLCKKHCPTDVISYTKDPKKKIKINFDYCKGCGICIVVCPKKYFTLIIESEKYN